MFLQAGSPAELRAYMAQYPDSRCIAGGTDIMPVQNRENDHEAVFIDISGAAALHRIVSEDGVLSVGAAATCLLYKSPSPRDYAATRMPSSA